MSPSSDYEAFRNTLAGSKRVVILTGAGLSVASGIATFRATFRGPNGLWKTKAYTSTVSSTPDEFKKDPSRVYPITRPNAAHHVISSLALHAVRSRLMAASTTDKTPLLITQNFDGLSFRALDALASRFDPSEPKIARERIIEMHGPINKTMCLQCKHVKHSLDVDLTLALSNITGQNVIPIEQLPRCGGPHNGSNRFGHCGGLLRPTIVWFDKAPEGMGEIAKELNWTDLLIIVGSDLRHAVKKRGGKIAVFKLEPSIADEHADFLFLGPCEVTLPSVLKVEISHQSHCIAGYLQRLGRVRRMRCVLVSVKSSTTLIFR
ncbi:sirtuin [Fomitopsis betulina]|nr:sirtuin [Fomitopsis betulina]